jgi:hypothetical protein
MSFPLYTSFSSVSEKPLTIAQKSEFMRNVKTMNTEGYELIYALIATFSSQTDKFDPLTIPYEGVIKKGSIDFNLLKLPNKLQQILFKFMKKHTTKMEEDKNLQELQNNNTHN